MEHLKYICPQCKSSNLMLEKEKCEDCGTEFLYNKDEARFSYNFRKLAFLKYGKKFLQNAILNNNGTLSYLQLAGGSLSLETRQDVKELAEFMAKHIETTNTPTLLDIGCGTLSMPGYIYHNLPIFKKRGVDLIGLDPIGNTMFDGHRIHGCSEFIPLADKSVGIAIFATSLDHVIDVPDTVIELNRVLANDGMVFVWAGESVLSWQNKVRRKIRAMINAWKPRTKIVELLKNEYSVQFGNYVIFDDFNMVAKKEPFAIDAFHSFHENKKFIEGAFSKQSLSLIDYISLPGMGYYCFKKKN